MENLLIRAGLTPLQAQMYMRLLSEGASFPPALAKSLKLTRTNAYKVLDSLLELGLATRQEVAKKWQYSAADPIALASLVAAERNKVQELENTVSNAITQLRNTYSGESGLNSTKVRHGREAIVRQFQQQTEAKQPVYFIKTRHDIPVMGFEVMDQIRKSGIKYDTKRYGLVPDVPEAPRNRSLDERTLLTRTWFNDEEYVAPVEWSVSGDLMNIFVYDAEPYVVTIRDKTVARAFQQVWKMLDKNIRSNPHYSDNPKKAARNA